MRRRSAVQYAIFGREMKPFYAIAFLLVLLLGCSNSVYYWEYDPVEEDIEGMILIRSKGKTTSLGQEMRVSFDYSFQLDVHEVTRGEYALYMERKKNVDSAMYPVTNVTYYDAILFANAKSKAEGLDTVYTYKKATFDADGSCSRLDNMGFHADVYAYRLPTEAEWTFAANTVWNPELAWNAENSDYRAHEVCTAEEVSGKKKGKHLCDMAGNVMEWVYDWYGTLVDTTVTDFGGAFNGGSLGERVLKGGSFRNNAAQMTIDNRKDVYLVTSSTKASYVGFRLAYGKIPSLQWTEFDGKMTSASRVNLLADATEVRSITGTYRTKLVYRDDQTGNLVFVDYSDANLRARRIVNSLDAYHPDISPDGRHVAFCTGLEGTNTKSELYVRNLDDFGSRLVKLDVESAAIPRWRVLENGDTAIVYVSNSGNNKDDATFFGESTWQVVFSRGKFKKPVKLFDGAYHGGLSVDESLAVTGARLLRARVAGEGSSILAGARDTVWYDGEQACNASLSKDSASMTLFLDFGGKAGRKFAGADYDVHEMLLVADREGKLAGAYPAPEGYSFDHSEWVGTGHKSAVVTLVNAEGVHEKVAVLNLKDSSIVELLEGEEVWHPCLWHAAPVSQEGTSGLDADSAGAYLSDDSWSNIQLRYNMEILWRNYATAEVVVVGSSRPFQAIAPRLFHNFKVINLAQTPNSIYMSRDFLSRYVFRQVKNLKYVVISLDIDFWWKQDRSEDNFFVSDYSEYAGYVYDENHDYWSDSIPEKLAAFTEQSLGSAIGPSFIYNLGYYAVDCGTWGGNPPALDVDSTKFDKHPEYVGNSLKALEQILEEAKGYGVEVVGIIFPQSPQYRKTGAFGRYGMRRSLAEKTIASLDSLSEEHSNFTFVDENKMGKHKYKDVHAENSDHLCSIGARDFSRHLDTLLLDLYKPSKDK